MQAGKHTSIALKPQGIDGGGHGPAKSNWKHNRRCQATTWHSPAQEELIKRAQKGAVTWMQTVGLSATFSVCCLLSRTQPLLTSDQALLSRDACVTELLLVGAGGRGGMWMSCDEKQLRSRELQLWGGWLCPGCQQ